MKIIAIKAIKQWCTFDWWRKSRL